MPISWDRPIYKLKTESGEQVLIDVTTSISPGLPPNKVIQEHIIPFFRRRGVETVLDFGAGSLRHTFPLLDARFQVCVVEFGEAFRRPKASLALQKARKHPNFSALIWPKQFIKDDRKFDAAMLNYVLQVMPKARERDTVLRYIYRKLEKDAYLLYMSRYNQMQGVIEEHKVEDGYYKWPKRKYHSFYREFTTEETHKMMSKFKFRRIRSLSERGTDQIFVYMKGKGTWI